MTVPVRAPARILVVATRRLGDVLLTTPLIRSLRRAWPQAHIAALVFTDTASALAANPDLDAVHTVERRPALFAHMRLLVGMWRNYDIALSTGPGDRPTFYACIAGKRCLGVLEPGAKQWWKRALLSDWVPFDDRNTHTVVMNLCLADLAGVARSHEVVAGWSAEDATLVQQTVGRSPYVVLHLQPKFTYKAWHSTGWIALGRWLHASGLQIVLTGSGEPDELAAIDQVLPQLPIGTLSVAGRFTLAQVACLLSQARLYVGPDTITTHMAAALGTPTIALFGPSNPVKWGPWPRGSQAERSPFTMQGSQRVGNVILIQGQGACVPCMLEGCDRHLTSQSACLQQLSAETVIRAAGALLDPAQRSAAVLD